MLTTLKRSRLTSFGVVNMAVFSYDSSEVTYLQGFVYSQRGYLIKIHSTCPMNKKEEFYFIDYQNKIYSNFHFHLKENRFLQEYPTE